MFCLVGIFCLVATACWGSPVFTPRILGGADVEITDVPFMATIEKDFAGHICGAVIISAEWVLTDAFCEFEPNVTLYSVRVGSEFARNITFIPDTGTVHNVTEWIVHPLEDVLIREYDFALIKVEPPFEFSENVAAVALPELYQETPGGVVGVVTGWGREEESGSSGPVSHLQYANMSLVSDPNCHTLLGSEYNERTLCARGATGDVALCWLDEGGPLVAEGILYGIALWPGTCASPLAMQYFGRVASVRDWIDFTIGVDE